MFDLSISEIAIIVIIAVVVIGPKELPRALATAGRWMAKARGIMSNFQTGFDAMVREAELQEMEKKWAADNERIMLEHPNLSDDEQPAHPASFPLEAGGESERGEGGDGDIANGEAEPPLEKGRSANSPTTPAKESGT